MTNFTLIHMARSMWAAFMFWLTGDSPKPTNATLLERQVLARWWNRIDLAIDKGWSTGKQNQARQVGHSYLQRVMDGMDSAEGALQDALDEISRIGAQ